MQDPDGGVIGEECDVWTQDCPEGEKCMPWANDGGNAWNATKCSPVDPDAKQVGDTCTVEGNAVSGVDDCVKGAMCWNVDPETNMGTCIEMCTGSPDAAMCSDPSYACAIYNDGVLIICVPPCDPLLQDCADGEVCIPNTSGDGFNCILDASGGMGQAGTPCEFVNVCNPGLMCVGAESVPGCMGSQGCCSPFCDLTDGNANTMCANAFTSPGAECVPFFEMGMAPPGHEDVGVCAIPQ
ncbi:MAG: ribulose phosphate epimerase [Deltaproteobacteria bacterium]|nr:MAG: ribulose phosphate epimerase [Deltaproteobacteria bacterium]